MKEEEILLDKTKSLSGITFPTKKYKSGEIAIEHDHWPCAWSGVYYLKGPKDSPGLFFPEMGEQGGERKLEKGLMIFFQGHIKHSVRPSKFKGSRYCVSGNISEKK